MLNWFVFNGTLNDNVIITIEIYQIAWNTKMIADPAVSVHYLTPEFHAKYWETRNAGATDYDMLV